MALKIFCSYTFIPSNNDVKTCYAIFKLNSVVGRIIDVVCLVCKLREGIVIMFFEF